MFEHKTLRDVTSLYHLTRAVFSKSQANANACQIEKQSEPEFSAEWIVLS